MALVPPLSGGMTIQNFARNPVLVNNRLSAACYRTQTLASDLAKSPWGKAQFNQIQIRLLKVGARVEELKTKVKFHFPSSFPLKELYETMLSNLSRAELCRSP